MDKRTQTAVQRLARTRPEVEALPAASAAKAIRSSVGLGRDPATSAAASSGIASPLTETGRTLHATQAVSSDGLFVWSVPEAITMEDAAGRTVVLIYAAP